VNFTKTFLPMFFPAGARVASTPLTLPMPQKLRSLLDQLVDIAEARQQPRPHQFGK
jgi:hypothetical protein